MNSLRQLCSRLAGLFRRRRLEAEMVEEMREHLARRTQQNLAAGMTPEEARYAAQREFGGVAQVQELCRDERSFVWLEQIFQDVRYTGRSLRRSPGFTAVIVLTLALVIGANTAIFSVVHAVLLRPLPYRVPERLTMIWTDNPTVNLGFQDLPPTPPDFLQWQREAKAFEQIAAFRPAAADLSEEGDPERVGGVQVTSDYFSLLGVPPALGRTFSADEMQPGDRVAVISHSLWQRRFGGRADILGHTVTINRVSRTIVGVMPAGFNFPSGTEMPSAYGLLPQTDIWRPLAEPAAFWGNAEMRGLLVIGRLGAGRPLAEASAEMAGLARAAAQQYPKSHAGWTVHLRPLTAQVTGPNRPVLWSLFGAVAFVLLIACANVASLMLTRAATRRKEIAVRAAIGAGRGRILRQLLVESTLLASCGGVAGLLVAAGLLKTILAFGPAGIPRLAETALNGPVLAFTLAISLATGLFFGLAPAWHATKLNLVEALGAGERTGSAAQHLAHRLMILLEVSLATVLLIGAGLMLQSLRHLLAVDPGFEPTRVAAFNASLFGERYNTGAKQRQFQREMHRHLAALPGVESVGAISSLPLSGSQNAQYFFPEGTSAGVAGPGPGPMAEIRKITPGYFETMGIRLLRGRGISDEDAADRSKICVVNETLARQFFRDVELAGGRIKLGNGAGATPAWTIVGVVRDVRGYALDTTARPQIYVPFEQQTQNEMTVVVRARDGEATSLEQPLREALKALDPALPVARFRTMESLIDSAVARPRFTAWLVGLFAFAALLLTMVGLYGVVSYAAAQRTREIGLRLALGASRGNVLGLVVREGMQPALLGLGFGLGGAIALTRVLTTQLYEISPTDPATLIGVLTLLALIVFAACWLPAWRAAKVDPMTALRAE